MQYLFMMLGLPGAGKSYVSGWLSPLGKAVHLRSDDMRLAMFGEDRLELHREGRYLRPLHNGMQYAARQVLLAGHSVILDVNMNRRNTRAGLKRMAAECGAQAIVIYIVVPPDVATQRVQDRATQGGHQLFGEAETLVARMSKNIETPGPDELVIELDGLQTAAQQQADYEQQLAALAVDPVQ